MKIIRAKQLKFVPASHEDPKLPGVLKKVLLQKDDLIRGRLQMINWCQLPAGKSFQSHYHEDMEEVFIILQGKAEIKVGNRKGRLGKGDAVVIPMRKIHKMKNVGSQDVEYLALGVSLGKGGKTIVV